MRRHQLFLKLADRGRLNAMLEELDAHLLRELSTIRGLRGEWRRRVDPPCGSASDVTPVSKRRTFDLFLVARDGLLANAGSG